MATIKTGDMLRTLRPGLEKYYGSLDLEPANPKASMTAGTSSWEIAPATHGGLVPTTTTSTGWPPSAPYVPYPSPPYPGPPTWGMFPIAENTLSVYGINIRIRAGIGTVLVDATFNHQTFTRAKLEEETIDQTIIRTIEDVQKEYPEHLEMVRAIDARMSGKGVDLSEQAIIDTIKYIKSLTRPKAMVYEDPSTKVTLPYDDKTMSYKMPVGYTQEYLGPEQTPKKP